MTAVAGALPNARAGAVAHERPRVAVIVPARDEEESLPGVVGAVRETGVTEVVVVDNGSSDRTAERAGAAGARVVREPRRGYGSACLAGLAALRSHPPDVVVFLDGDGSDDPGEIERVLAPIVEGRADLVIGARADAEAGALTPLQRAGNRIAATMLRVCFGALFTDLGPFRAIRWGALESLAMRDRGYGWTVEMQARAARAGLRAVEVPVSCRRRRTGRSKVSGTVRGVLGAGVGIPLTVLRVRLGR